MVIIIKIARYILSILKVHQKTKCFVNGEDKIDLDMKLLSKLVNSNVKSYGISGDFTTIVCFCTKKEKLIFLKMRKYLKYTDDKLIHQYAHKFNIPM
ncbi:hypothetical protein CP985_03180 [Malaciobacter mytili LMG 24559]|uniref:Uncharacterized protein n=1 Tax=Malaciobacter mytili LMG 24559 TaxID=1032238 RepID=A0AAX2AHF6_9BACT|nr:hypothetical protein [Malaciobacter mytili]AXH16361.1 hypothetical protein AMYT_a0061 [Malaciobacter mytili LMG 24559]RXK16427.1 hypothetical protein CP985_03180 [Malaciobacter mytili LMG 24559]